MPPMMTGFVLGSPSTPWVLDWLRPLERPQVPTKKGGGRLPGPMQPHLDRCRCHREDRRNIACRELFDVAKKQHLPVVVWQHRDAGPHRRAHLLALQQPVHLRIDPATET